MKSLIGSVSRQMTEDESKVFINAYMAPRFQTEFDESFSEELGFLGKVLKSRLSSCSTAKITNGLALLLVFMSNGNPGNIVMWAYTMHVIAKQNEGQMVTIEDFSNEFPMGVPSEEGLSSVWEAQKDSKGRNLIDKKTNWN